MRTRFLSHSTTLLCVVVIVVLTSGNVAATAQPSDVTLEEWMPGGFNQPTYVTNDGDERLFVVEQPGRIQVVADVASPNAGSTIFLDLTDRVGANGSERGLLSIAFPPDSHDANVVYASYTDLDGNSVISRFGIAEDGMTADPCTERIVLTQQQPFQNHNGGLIRFGPDDDMMYIGFGDGGSQGDPDGNAQNLTTWLGKILRIDVNPAIVGDAAYVVPDDNPFVDAADAAPEVWMYGLRNPWRFAFDPDGTMIAVADVGQNLVEEVTILPIADASGANLGWDIMEGASCYENDNCDTQGLVPPSLGYTHDEGGCSVTGGYFIDGAYVYGDYCSGLVWLGTQGDGGWTAGNPIDTGLSISSFGLGADGTVYLADLASGSIFTVTVP